MFAGPANCGAVIPCHNEGGTIGDVVRGVRALISWVLVVDDGSTDATARIAQEAGAQVLSLSARSGKGNALRRGWRVAEAAGLEWVLMLDGDGQHEPAEAERLLAVASLRAPLVVGNRFPAPAMPAMRRRVNEWMSHRMTRMTGQPLPDSQCGYRLAHLPALRRLGLTSQCFEIESEMCLAFARAGHAIAFVPVSARYGAEQSKIRPIADTWRWCRWYLCAGRWDGWQSRRSSPTGSPTAPLAA